MHPLDLALDHCINGRAVESLAILQTMPDDIRARFNMGWHYMRLGDMRKGMEGLALGRYLNVFGSQPIATDKPIWKDQPLLNSKVLIHGEGGYGDEIANVRFARDFFYRGAEVTVSCSRSLMPLFRKMPWISNLIDRDYAHAADFDYWVPAMSAPLVLGTTYETLSGQPYIPRIKSGECHNIPRIGLKWSGNPQFEHEQHRRFPTELMWMLANTGLDFVSLQKGEDSPFPQPPMSDWLETARAIADLDLVITSCTSIAHLAGAMGVPTWVVVPIMPYYIWAMPGNKSSWYNTVTLFRQTRYGHWDDVFWNINRELGKRWPRIVQKLKTA